MRALVCKGRYSTYPDITKEHDTAALRESLSVVGLTFLRSSCAVPRQQKNLKKQQHPDLGSLQFVTKTFPVSSSPTNNGSGDNTKQRVQTHVEEIVRILRVAVDAPHGATRGRVVPHVAVGAHLRERRIPGGTVNSGSGHRVPIGGLRVVPVRFLLFVCVASLFPCLPMKYIEHIYLLNALSSAVLIS